MKPFDDGDQVAGALEIDDFRLAPRDGVASVLNLLRQPLRKKGLEFAIVEAVLPMASG